MTEFSLTAVRLGFVLLYALAFVGAAAWLRRVPDRLTPYGYLLATVIGLAPVVLALQELGIGQVALGAGQVDLVNVVRNLVAYPVIYGSVARLGGASRRLTATVVVLGLVPVTVVSFASVFGASVVALGVLGAVILPYPVLLYLFFVPIWDAAGELPPRRRLLHWKARNMLLFFYSMVIALILVLFSGVLTEEVLVTFLLEYSLFFFYAGVPGFVLYKFGQMAADTATQFAPDGSLVADLLPTPANDRG